MKLFRTILACALVLTQLLPPSSAWALRGQPPGETAVSGGLEEALVSQPARGFATRVDRQFEAGVQTAARAVGQMVATGSWDINSGSLSEPEIVAGAPPEALEQAAAARQRTAEGVEWLTAHRSIPVVADVLARLRGRRMPLEFRADHGMTLDLADDDTAVRIDTTVARQLETEGDPAGRRALYGLGLLHEAAQGAGYSTRASIHLLIAAYEGLSAQEREHLHALLRSPYVDHGGIWDFFFRQVTDDRQFQGNATRAQKKLPTVHLSDKDIQGVDTITLMDRRDSPTASTQEQARLDWVIDYRDTWVSWVTGMLQFDIPFDYQRFMQIYRDPSIDLDTKRQLLFDVLRGYSMETERQNAERVARDAAERGQILIGGRYSTAFVDEANEVASAEFVVVTDKLREAVLGLTRAAEEMRLSAAGDRAAENAAEILVRSAEGLMTTVLKSGGVTRGEVMRFLDIEDHVGEVYGALEKCQVGLLRAADGAQAAAQKRHEMEVRVRGGKFDRSPFDRQRKNVEAAVARMRRLADGARAAFLDAPRQPYARMVALQRPSPTGAINFAYGIGFAKKGGQAPNLRERVRTGGQNSWMSPDTAWVEWVNYMVEFIPLFIGERILRFELPDGRQVDRREVEVDQKQLEAAIRGMADPFAADIERTMTSEYVTLAREAVCEVRLGAQAIDTIAAERRVLREEAYRLAIREALPAQREQLAREVAAVAAGIAARAEREAEQIEQILVDTWAAGPQPSRFDILRRTYLFDPEGTARYGETIGEAVKELGPRRDADLLKRYETEALESRRPLPMWIMGTTEAPGLTESFCMGWLEEEMALRNVIRTKGHEQDVRELQGQYRAELVEAGRVVLREFGYERQIDARSAERGIPPEEAVLDLIGENEVLQQEVAKLAVLRLWAQQGQPGYRFSAETPDPQAVLDKLEDAELRPAVDAQARQIVWLQNRADLQADVDAALAKGAPDFDAALRQVIEAKQVLGQRPYEAHWQSARRWVARDLVIRELGLQPETMRWYRDHTALSRTTARQTVVDRYNLRAAMTDPRSNYQSDGVYLSESDTWAPNPWKMRYLIAAGPSQVDLGGEDTTSRQLKSISLWPKWGGVVSQAGEEALRRFYGAYHYRLEIRRLDQAEDMKVLKNTRTAMGRAVMNLISAVTVNDVQDVAIQTRTHGDPLADMFAYQEPDKPGATAGYCIPKDGLFKVFVSQLQDAQALRYVGVPDAQVPEALALIRRVWASHGDYDTEIEWERWATAELIALNESFKQYVDLGGRGVLIFNVTRIAKVLDRLGVPSAYPGGTQDLYRGLVASVAAERIADLEAVNRMEAFRMPVDLFDAIEHARRMNPGASLTPDGQVTMQMPAPYKGTGKGSQHLADVRYSRWLMAAYLMSILPGVPPQAGLEEALDLEVTAHRLLEPLTASLRPQDEALFQLGMRGFRPESEDPVDRRVTRFVAERLMGIDRRSVETLPGFVAARQAISPDAPDYLDRMEFLVTEWIARTAAEDRAYAPQVAQLRARFRPRVAPARITITASPQTAVADVLGHITEKELWESAADEALAILMAHGLTLQEIRARAKSGDPFPAWIAHLPADEQLRITEQVGGRHIPLAIREGGLGANFWQDIQGRDVVVLGVPYDANLRANPAHIIQSMRRGNPGFLGVISDHAVQGRPRVWHGHRQWAPDVMLAYAAGLAFDKEGRPITDWARRAQEGRRVVYVANSLPAGNPIVETWRNKEMEMEGRSIRLFQALQAVATAGSGAQRRAAVDRALEIFRQEISLGSIASEFDQVRSYEREVGPDGLNLFKERDRAMTACLGALLRGMNEAVRQRGDSALWLGRATRAEIAALGLMFLLNGETTEKIDEALGTVDQALAAIRQELEERGLTLDTRFQQPIEPDQAAAWTSLLIEPQLQVEVSEKKRQQVEASSVKAPETVSKALAARAALVLQAEREVHLARRGAGYRQVMEGLVSTQAPEARWDAALSGARQDLEAAQAALGSPDPAAIHTHTGRLFAWMQTAGHAAVDRWVPDAQERLNWHEQINALTRGRELNENAWNMFVRLHGLLPRLFELAGGDAQRRGQVGALMEMADAALALEKMAPYFTLDRAYINEPALWLDLLGFFGVTINDHFDQRLPWAVSPARGNGFQELFNAQERVLDEGREGFDLYRFAWDSHAWLYGFLRQLMVAKTQLADMPADRRDPLLGVMAPAGPALSPIGGGAPAGDTAMQLWRGYLQLREIGNWCQTSVAMLQDTFRPLAEQVGPVSRAMMPYVFAQPVDPALIHADTGAGLVILSGIGRPHYQQMMREGADPDLGDNVFITQHGRFLTPEGREPGNPQEFDRSSLWIDDAHFWVPLETFREMLMQTEGMTGEQADAKIAELQAAKQIHPKGVRVAARFTRPVAVGAAVTLHGHYIEPQLQQAGYPTAEKSGVLFEVTYGKIYGPEIVAGRPLSYPRQENVYQQDTLGQSAADAKARILQQVQAYAAQLGSPAFFVKGSRESGSRNLQYFDAARPDGSADPAVIAAAAEFAYQVSTGQDVVLSDDQSLRNSNQTFLTPAIVESMRTRAVREYGIDVNLNEPGKADVTTVRVTVVSPRPGVPYEPAHVLLITSYTGRVTNMARQNVAEPLRPEFLQPRIRDDFLQGLMASAPEAMRAMADFARRFWHDGVTLPDGRQFPAYKEVYRAEHGEYPKEFDARGVPYWYPTWLMLDYIPSAVFESVKNGQPLTAARIVDIDPGDPQTGTPPVFTLQDGNGNRIQGRVTGHVPWLLEWNTGIGQIPEYNRREQYWEYARARREAAQAGEPEKWFDHVNWEHVGVADRKALQTWLAAARETRAAKGFPAGWPEAPAPPALAPALAAPSAPAKPVRVDPLAAALRGVRSRLGATPLTEETLSLWLSAYALRRMGPVLVERRQQLGDPATYEQTAGTVTSEVLATLQDGQLRQEMAELIEEESIPISAGRLTELLQGNSPQAQSYRERIALQVLGDVMADPQTVIPVAVLPEPLSPETVAARLTQPNRMAVVVGKELRMDHAVEPFALSAIGQPVDVLGVHADWVTESGEVTRVQVYDPASRLCWECPLTRPMRLPRADHPGATPRAYIVDLPEQTEVQEHERITQRLRAGGIEPVNPAGEAQARADDKAYLLSQSDPGRVHWNLVSRSATPLQVQSRVSGFIGSHPGERLVVRPRAGTTGAAGVSVIEPGPAQAEQTAAAISALQAQGQKEGHDVILERFWGNVTMGGREFVVRSNVSAGEIQSGNALVAPYGERVVSTRRGAVAFSTEDVLDHLIGPAGAVAISPERMAELDREAVAAAQRISQGVPLADRLGIVALDRRFWVDEEGQVRQVILEANARGGGFIAAEPTAVAPSFWREMGLHQPPSLLQWAAALSAGPRSQATLEPHYLPAVLEAKRGQLEGWMRGLSALRSPGGGQAFDPARGTVLTRTPGRAPLPPGGRHMDYIGFMGGSLGLPTLQEVCTSVQVVDGMNGAVEVYAVDAPDPAVLSAFPDGQKGPRVVSLNHPWLSPDRPIRTLAEWDAWAGQTAKERRQARSPDEPAKAKLNYADDLVSCLVAFLRTDFGDPSGRARAYFERLAREGKGLRIAIASDLPSGGGLSSSSAVLEGAAQAFNEMAGIGLDVPGLVHLGYAERFYAGTQGGVKDHAHFMYPPAFLGVAPTRVIETLPMVPGVSLILLDSGISRDNAPKYSEKLRQTGDDEQNIKGRTGIGYALGVLWIRHHHPELEARLRPNTDPSNPYGFLRELMPGAPDGLTLAEIYGLLREIPAGGLTRDQMRQAMPEFQSEFSRLFEGRPEPPRPYPLREMTLFGFAEEARSMEAVRVLRQLEQGVPPEAVLRQLLEVIRTAHHGDRVAQHVIAEETGGTGLQAEPAAWDWRVSDDHLDQMIGHPGDLESVLWRQPGWLERSIEPIDRMVDVISDLNRRNGGNLGEALIIGAGLGGTVEALWASTQVPLLLETLEREHYEKLGLSHTPAVVAQPGKAASVFFMPRTPFIGAGLEELPQAAPVVAAQTGELPPVPVVGHTLQDVGSGWMRLVYTLSDGQTWFGGLVGADVFPANIHPTAYVAVGSSVAGPASRLEAGAKLLGGSTVVDSAVREGAEITRSVAERALVGPRARVEDAVLQPAFEPDDWSYSAATQDRRDLSVSPHAVQYGGDAYEVEVGTGAQVRGSVVQSSLVDRDSRVEGSVVVISRWGPETRLDGVKSSLVTAVEGHAQVRGVRHGTAGDLPAATEVSETAILGLPPEQYPGTQFALANGGGYTEAVMMNRVPLASYDGKELSVRWYEHLVPSRVLLGDYSIFSIFAGAPNPDSVKTDGVKTPRRITRLTGAPGEQSSQHGRIIADPLSMTAGLTKVIGRLMGFPDIESPEQVITEPEVTHVGALSLSGVDERLGQAGSEVWGQLLPGETRGQLSRSAGTAPGAFLNAPEVIFTLMGQLSQGLPDGQKDRYDDLPKRLLESGLAMSRWALDQEQAKGIEVDPRVVERLRRYVGEYQDAIGSGAWAGTWVQDGDLRKPQSWQQAPSPAQLSVDRLLRLPDGVDRPDWSAWFAHCLKAEELRVEPAAGPLEPVPAEGLFQSRRITGQDSRYYHTLEGGRIGREVDLAGVHESAVIGPGSVLTGATTSVAAGARLTRVVADQSVIGKDARLISVKASRAIVEPGVRLTWAKLKYATVGAGTEGTFVAIDDSQIGPGNTLHPFALIVGSATSPSNIVGGWLIGARTQPGYMNMHLSTAAMRVAHQPVTFKAGGKTRDLGAASLNVAGGLRIGSEGKAPVRVSVAYPLSNSTIGPGARVGAFSVVKDEVAPDAALLPFTLHAFANASPGDANYGKPGRHNDRIGGSLDLTGMFMRNFIYRTKKGIWDDLKSQGLSDEQIRSHRRLLEADYMVEATIVQTLRDVMAQLGRADGEAAGRLPPVIGDLLEAVERDLAQIDVQDQASLGGRSAADRQGIQGLIARVRGELDALPPDGRPGGTSSSGHTPAQLLDGIRRLAENLDGRWRMRNHTFTEVEWRYVARDEQNRARDTWEPVPLAAGLEEDEVVRMILDVISDEDFQLDMNAVYPDGREGGGSVIGWQIALALGLDGVPIARGIEAYSHLGSGASILVLGKNAADGHLLAPAATMAGRSIPPAFLRAVALYNESLSAGLEETDADRLLQEKAGLEEPVSVMSGIGVIAGPYPYGLAYGTALTRVKGADGKLIPVVMIVENERQKELAGQVASAAHVILLSEHRGDVGRAVQAAKDYLAANAEVSEPLQIGTHAQDSLGLLQELARFGITPEAESIHLWTRVIRDATLAFQA